MAFYINPLEQHGLEQQGNIPVNRGEIELVYATLDKAREMSYRINKMADMICGYKMGANSSTEPTAVQALPSGIIAQLNDSAKSSDAAIESALSSLERISEAFAI